MLQTMPLDVFLDRLAARTPTPGGGGAAALSGAMGAALISMVIRFTIGKPGHEDAEDELVARLQESERIRVMLLKGAEDDAKAFDQLMLAYRMPRGDQALQTLRKQALDKALKAATEVPMECVRQCWRLMAHTRAVAEKGSRSVISDAGVAVMAAYAGLMSAALNVRTNLANIEDEPYVADMNNQLQGIQTDCESFKSEVYTMVADRMASQKH